MVSAMITAADTQQDGVVSFEEFVPMVRSQLGAVAPTTGWGHQTEEDALAQLLENSATMAKCGPHLLPSSPGFVATDISCVWFDAHVVVCICSQSNVAGSSGGTARSMSYPPRWRTARSGSHTDWSSCRP